MLCDNQAALATANEQKGLTKAKHIDIRHHYLRNLIEQGTIKIKYIESKLNIANIFTKTLPLQDFNKFKQQIGLHYLHVKLEC